MRRTRPGLRFERENTPLLAECVFSAYKPLLCTRAARAATRAADHQRQSYIWQALREALSIWPTRSADMRTREDGPINASARGHQQKRGLITTGSRRRAASLDTGRPGARTHTSMHRIGAPEDGPLLAFTFALQAPGSLSSQTSNLVCGHLSWVAPTCSQAERGARRRAK